MSEKLSTAVHQGYDFSSLLCRMALGFRCRRLTIKRTNIADVVLALMGLAGLTAAPEFWIATPWLISFGLLATLVWAFGRRKDY